jgi:hypothetical protein
MVCTGTWACMPEDTCEQGPRGEPLASYTACLIAQCAAKSTNKACAVRHRRLHFCCILLYRLGAGRQAVAAGPGTRESGPTAGCPYLCEQVPLERNIACIDLLVELAGPLLVAHIGAAKCDHSHRSRRSTCLVCGVVSPVVCLDFLLHRATGDGRERRRAGKERNSSRRMVHSA